MEVHSDRYDYPLSAAVAIAIQAEPYRCWRNAALAVILLPELFACYGITSPGNVQTQ